MVTPIQIVRFCHVEIAKCDKRLEDPTTPLPAAWEAHKLAYTRVLRLITSQINGRRQCKEEPIYYEPLPEEPEKWNV